MANVALLLVFAMGACACACSVDAGHSRKLAQKLGYGNTKNYPIWWASPKELANSKYAFEVGNTTSPDTVHCYQQYSFSDFRNCQFYYKAARAGPGIFIKYYKGEYELALGSKLGMGDVGRPTPVKGEVNLFTFKLPKPGKYYLNDVSSPSNEFDRYNTMTIINE